MLTVSVFFLSVVIASVMIFDAIRELVFGMRNVVYMMMAMLIVDNYFVSGPFDRSVRVNETMSVSCQSTLDGYEGQYSQWQNKLATNCCHLHRILCRASKIFQYFKKKNVFTTI